MKDYKEVAKNVFQRSEEIAFENRNKKKRRLKAGSLAGCFCLAVLSFGAWQREGFGETPVVSTVFAEESADENSSTALGTLPQYSENSDENSGTALGTLPQYSENSSESVSDSANFIGIPDDGSSFAGVCFLTMVSSYPGGGASSYASPDNGTVSYSIPLSGAMKEYGESVLYRVAVDLFRGQERLDPNSQEVKNEIERLAKLNYIVAFETYNDGTDNYCYFTLHVEYGQLKNFAANNDYGYMLFLYDEYVD